MTIPQAYRHASGDFDAFLAEVAEETGLATINQSYTVVDGVFRTFRRRLTAEQGIAFAQLLPPVLAAMFLADWAPSARASGWERSTLTREVQDLRRHHNFAPDTAIRDVAAVLRRHVDSATFDVMLDRLPSELRAGAKDFWQGDLA